MSWRQYRALVATFLRVAWRGPAATDGAKRRRGAFAKGFVGYLFVGAIMMLVSVAVPHPRLAGFLLQSMSFMMVALSLLNIYGDLVFDARDVPLLFWRPLDPRAYFAARLTAIVVYFAAVTTALNLPGALVLALRFGPAWYPAAHLLGAYAGALAALLLALLLLLVLLRVIGRERLRDTVAWVQIAVTFLFVGGNQLLGRARFLEHIPASSVFTGRAAFLLPMSWAQAIADLLSLRALPGQREIAIVGIAAPLGVGAMLVVVFGRGYAEILRALGEGDARREAPAPHGMLRRWLERAAAHDPTARAGFLLAWVTIRRARDFKVRALPQFGLPVIFTVMAFVQDARPLAAVVPAMLALATCQSLACIVGSEHAEAGWVWGLAPVASPGPALRGASLAILGTLVAPVLLLLGAAMLVVWGPLHAFGFVAFAAALAIASLLWTRALLHAFPCTVPLEEARRESLGIRALGIFAAMSVLAGIDAALVHYVGPWVSIVIAAPILFWGWRGLAGRG